MGDFLESLLGWLAALACLAIIIAIGIGITVLDKHGDAIANNLGNKIEAWTK